MMLSVLPVVWGISLFCAFADADESKCREVQDYDATSQGTISSPLYGQGMYPKNLWCEYRIKAPQGHRIKVTFKDLDIGEMDDGRCAQDKLVVTSKEKKSHITELCGSELPRPLMSMKGENELNFLLFTGASSAAGKGFLLEYQSSPDFNDELDDYQCRFLIEYTAPGTLSSPFYGKFSYSKNLRCEYKISAPQGHRIKITFKDLDIAKDEDGRCRKDKLAVYTKDKKDYLAEFCGNDLPRPLLSKKGENELRLMFATGDSAVQGRGFLLEFESSPDMDDVMDEYQCRNILEFDATIPGEISSPLYGKHPYPNRLSCQYKITAPEGYRIKITFKDLDLQSSNGCSKDFIIVYSKGEKSAIALLCGHNTPRPLLSLEGENEMKLVFRSDATITGKGFRLHYEASPYFTSVCGKNLKECRNRNCYSTEQTCDGIDQCRDGTDEENCGKPIDLHPEKCGMPEVEPNILKNDADRIVGGEEAIPHSWPWQVSIQKPSTEPSQHFCGGTLINEQWVLTAAHCVSGFRYPGTIKVRVGTHNVLNRTEYEQDRIALRIIVYPELENDDIFDGNMDHDMALMKLNAPVKLNKGVQPACLPSSDMKPQPGWVCYSTGWGETRGSGSANRLKQSDMVVKSREDCGYLEESEVCVGKPYHSTCHGDSGGPLNCKVEGRWYSYGALSLLVPINEVVALCSGPDPRTHYASSQLKAKWIRDIVDKYS